MGGGRGGGGVPHSGRPPSHVAYYVALAGILSLMLLTCCYFFYFFIRRVKELSEQMSPTPTPVAPVAPVTPVTPRTPLHTVGYPIQPVVRESATAMAKLCKQLPASGGKGDIVFPTSTSPEALHTDTGDDAPPYPAQCDEPLPPPPPQPPQSVPDNKPAPPIVSVTRPDSTAVG